MKYFNAIPEEQETIINILYEDQIVRVYSNQIQIIQNLTQILGQPNKKYKKSRTYWSGSSWDIGFHNRAKITELFSQGILIETNLKPKIKSKLNFEKDSFSQMFLDL